MIVGVVVIVLAVGIIALSLLQLRGAIPIVGRTRANNVSSYINLLVGLFLIALGVLRVTGLL